MNAQVQKLNGNRVNTIVQRTHVDAVHVTDGMKKNEPTKMVPPNFIRNM